jgi:hypothetical protein
MYQGQVNTNAASQANLQREQLGAALRPGVPPPSQVQEALSNLDACISSLGASIDGLDQKTACVQAPVPSEVATDGPESHCSPLVSQINSLRDRIVRIDHQARGMLNRIEL